MKWFAELRYLLGQMFKPFWYALTDQRRKAYGFLPLHVFGFALVLVSFIALGRWAFLVYGLAAIGVGLYCWYLEWRLKSRQKKQADPPRLIQL